MRTPQTIFISCAVAVLALAGISSAQVTRDQENQSLGMEAHVGKLTGHAKDAALNYRRYCAGCHGDLGDGEGENAVWLDPKPRNFTLAQFKCRSTPSGTLPTDEDLYSTVGRGLQSSNMPSWNPLSDQQRIDLVAYVKHFSERWKTEKPGAVIPIPAEPEVTPDRVKAGQALFQKLECWKCHGVEGRANGPSADTLTDDQNRPIKPFNFHDQTRFKCGTSNSDLYRIFMSGLDGTPMPSFVDNVKPDEAWDLVFYLRTLQPQESKEKQIAKQLGLKPINPNAPAAPAPTGTPGVAVLRPGQGQCLTQGELDDVVAALDGGRRPAVPPGAGRILHQLEQHGFGRANRRFRRCAVRPRQLVPREPPELGHGELEQDRAPILAIVAPVPLGQEPPRFDHHGRRSVDSHRVGRAAE